MATTDYHGWPLPDGTDLPLVHVDMKALGDAIDKDIPVIVNTYAAMQALPPILNLQALVRDLSYKHFVHNGTVWKPSGAANSRVVIPVNSARVGNATGLQEKVNSGEVQLIRQVGTAVQGTDQSGYIGLNYPEPFPNGVLKIGFYNGDTGAGGRGRIFSSAGAPFTQTTSTGYLSVADGNGNPLTNTVVRFEFDVEGW
jgi:hypothetical protein